MVTQVQRDQMFPVYPDDSRIWIFQSVQPWEGTRQAEALRLLEAFLGQWKAHQQPVRASGALLMSHFLVIVADERVAGVSGCAGDKLHELVRRLGDVLGVDLFERLHIPVLVDDTVEFVRQKVLRDSAASNLAEGDPLIFDHTVGDLGQWRRAWVRPLSESWLARRRTPVS